MGEWIELTADDGFRLAAWQARPAGTPRAGIVVIQEIFGVNAHIREVADGFATDGYLVVAPALFDRVERGVELGYDAAGMERGIALARGAVDPARALVDLRAAVDAVAYAGRVGVVGYCYGGLLAWLAACGTDGVAAAVSYYGGGVAGQLALEPRCPVLFHFGARDAHIPPDEVDRVRAAVPDCTVHVYDADHGFNCDHRESFDAAAASLARQRTLDFFRDQLGAGA
jgi:carboxymethylenebutenolidase